MRHRVAVHFKPTVGTQGLQLPTRELLWAGWKRNQVIQCRPGLVAKEGITDDERYNLGRHVISVIFGV